MQERDKDPLQRLIPELTKEEGVVTEFFEVKSFEDLLRKSVITPEARPPLNKLGILARATGIALLQDIIEFELNTSLSENGESRKDMVKILTHEQDTRTREDFSERRP